MPYEALLPASGTLVRARDATGDDELLVLQSVAPPAATIVALAERVLCAATGEPIDWPSQPAVDIGAAALAIRASWLGDRIVSEVSCRRAGCGEPLDVGFSVRAYLAHHRPRRPRRVIRSDDGWLRLADAPVRFRAPTVADLLAAGPGGERALRERCVSPSDVPPAVLRRVERVLESLAPPLDGEVSGTCPACGSSVALGFEPIEYVLAELRQASRDLDADVHALAFAYHWSEHAILRLARRRRTGYVALIRHDLAVA